MFALCFYKHLNAHFDGSLGVCGIGMQTFVVVLNKDKKQAAVSCLIQEEQLV